MALASVIRWSFESFDGATSSDPQMILASAIAHSYWNSTLVYHVTSEPAAATGIIRFPKWQHQQQHHRPTDRLIVSCFVQQQRLPLLPANQPAIIANKPTNHSIKLINLSPREQTTPARHNLGAQRMHICQFEHRMAAAARWRSVCKFWGNGLARFWMFIGVVKRNQGA